MGKQAAPALYYVLAAAEKNKRPTVRQTLSTLNRNRDRLLLYL